MILMRFLLVGIANTLVGPSIIGEHLAKIYTETKRRLRYIIEKTTGQDGVVSLSADVSPNRF